MHSQKNEELIILNNVSHIKAGRFLDIGAYDGYHYSNTMALVTLGWSGIMVEPGLQAFQELLRTHGDNPKVTLIHAAISTGVYLDLSQFWNNPQTFSTTLPSNRDRFIHEGFSEPYWVPTIGAGIVLQKFPGPIHVLSIDTEGTSVDLFKAFPFQMAKPHVVCVEHDNRQKECTDFATVMGYKLLMQNEENLIFGDTLPEPTV